MAQANVFQEDAAFTTPNMLSAEKSVAKAKTVDTEGIEFAA